MSTHDTGRSRQYAVRDRLRSLGYVCHIGPGSKKIDISAYFDGDGSFPRALSVEVGGEKPLEVTFADLRHKMRENAVRHSAPMLALIIDRKWRYYVSEDEWFSDLVEALEWIREEAA